MQIAKENLLKRHGGDFEFDSYQWLLDEFKREGVEVPQWQVLFFFNKKLKIYLLHLGYLIKKNLLYQFTQLETNESEIKK